MERIPLKVRQMKLLQSFLGGSVQEDECIESMRSSTQWGTEPFNRWFCLSQKEAIYFVKVILLRITA